jgi:hypothetical protein
VERISIRNTDDAETKHDARPPYLNYKISIRIRQANETESYSDHREVKKMTSDLFPWQWNSAYENACLYKVRKNRWPKIQDRQHGISCFYIEETI